MYACFSLMCTALHIGTLLFSYHYSHSVTGGSRSTFQSASDLNYCICSSNVVTSSLIPLPSSFMSCEQLSFKQSIWDNASVMETHGSVLSFVFQLLSFNLAHEMTLLLKLHRIAVS